MLNELKRNLEKAEQNAHIQEALRISGETADEKLVRYSWTFFAFMCESIMKWAKKVTPLKPYVEAVQNFTIWQQIHEFMAIDPDYTSYTYWLAQSFSLEEQMDAGDWKTGGEAIHQTKICIDLVVAICKLANN
ncbi:hypothetical protein EG329_012720 [Mollisiaceae sp. DMI_Dod_QoI]|nr:hypothetical protein EG329_012720 [Helotiales sp. DMI_Dod_QoI]